MKIIMKAYEKKCIDYTKRYKGWDATCIAKDSYLAGYNQAFMNLQEMILYSLSNEEQELVNNFENNMNQEVEVEFKDGEHQLLNNPVEK